MPRYSYGWAPGGVRARRNASVRVRWGSRGDASRCRFTPTSEELARQAGFLTTAVWRTAQVPEGTLRPSAALAATTNPFQGAIFLVECFEVRLEGNSR